jgi:hypothetical protein
MMTDVLFVIVVGAVVVALVVDVMAVVTWARRRWQEGGR